MTADLKGWPFGDLRRGAYGTILADPPWSFTTWSGTTCTPHRTTVDHYRTTPTGMLTRLPVGDLAARDCALFMWAVDSHLDVAIDLGRSWGFAFKTVVFTWAKTNAHGTFCIGMGYWSRKQTEQCLLFTRGSPKRRSKAVRQLIVAPRREHSRKPDEQYPRIEALVDGPYAELFARTRRKRWAAWGNEVGKFEEKK